MRVKGVRLYAANHLQLDDFDLPEIKDDKILVKVISNSICMSTYKALIQGSMHKRVPDNIATNPTIMGHEMSGEIIEVGKKWQDKYKAGQRFALQPALNYKGSPEAPGYSFEYFGGLITYCIIPREVMELGYLLPYEGDSFYEASLSEPMSCIISAYHSNYHTTFGNYTHEMGIKKGGCLALFAAGGPMGLGAIDYGLSHEQKPKTMVIVDIDDARLNRAEELFADKAKKEGVELHFVNPKGKETEEVNKTLMELSHGKGYDDIYVYAPVTALIEQADSLLAKDGCLNFFAGPADKNFQAKINFYNIHYTPTHVMGSTGGSEVDMLESLDMTKKGQINPAVMVTHIGGLNSAIDTISNLPNIPGGKKLVYVDLDMEMTAISDFAKSNDPVLKELAKIVAKTKGIWNAEAESYLLKHGKKIKVS